MARQKTKTKPKQRNDNYYTHLVDKQIKDQQGLKFTMPNVAKVKDQASGSLLYLVMERAAFEEGSFNYCKEYRSETISIHYTMKC